MAYSKPTAADFKARFPEFAPVADSLINLVIDESEREVSSGWEEDDRRPALLYLVAHKLTLEGEPARSVGIAAGSGSQINITGPMTRRKVGDVEVQFAGAGSSAGGGSGNGSGYSSAFDATAYGRQYLLYLRRSFAGVWVV